MICRILNGMTVAFTYRDFDTTDHIVYRNWLLFIRNHIMLCLSF